MEPSAEAPSWWRSVMSLTISFMLEHLCTTPEFPLLWDTTQESRMMNPREATLALWGDSEIPCVGVNLMNLNMPLLLGYGSMVGFMMELQLLELYQGAWVPSLGLLARPALGKPPEHHPHLQPSPRSCPEMGKRDERDGNTQNVTTQDLQAGSWDSAPCPFPGCILNYIILCSLNWNELSANGTGMCPVHCPVGGLHQGRVTD